MTSGGTFPHAAKRGFAERQECRSGPSAVGHPSRSSCAYSAISSGRRSFALGLVVSLPEVGGPKIHTRGSGIDDAAFSSVVPPKLVDALERAASDGVTDTHALRQLSRWVIGK